MANIPSLLLHRCYRIKARPRYVKAKHIISSPNDPIHPFRGGGSGSGAIWTAATKWPGRQSGVRRCYMGQTLIRQKTSCCPFLLKPRFKFTRSNYNIVQMDKVLGGSGCDWEPSRGDIRPFYSSWVLQHTNQLKWGFFSFYLTIDNCQNTQIKTTMISIFWLHNRNLLDIWC